MVVLPHSHNFLLLCSSSLYPKGQESFINKCRPFPSPRARKTATEVSRRFAHIMSLVSSHEHCCVYKQAFSFECRWIWGNSSNHVAAHSHTLQWFGEENNGYQHRRLCAQNGIMHGGSWWLAQNGVLAKGNLFKDILQNIQVWLYS